MPRPVQVYSFSDFSKRTPTAQPPGDRLDAQFRAHADAIAELQQIIAELRRQLQAKAPPQSKEPTLSTPSLYVGAGGPYAGDDKGATATSADYAQVAIDWAEHMPDTIPGNTLAVTAISGDHWSSRWWANRAAQLLQSLGVAGSIYPNGVFCEALTVTGANTLSPLTRTPAGPVLLTVNDEAFLPVGSPPPFTVIGQTIVWGSTLYGLSPGDAVAAWYPYGAPAAAPPGTVATPATTVPLVAGAAAIGVSAEYARADHIHPSEHVNVRNFGAVGDGVTDDTAAIQAAINSLPAAGGVVLFACKNYRITSTLTIGNGTISALSTKQGVILRGESIPNTGTGYAGALGPRLTWAGGAAAMIKIAGPLQGWGLQNLILDGALVAGSYGLTVGSAAFGDCSNLTVTNFFVGIYSTSYPLGGYSGVSNVDAEHNNWTNISVYAQAATGSKGIFLHGDPGGTSDTDYNLFTNIQIGGPGGAANYGLYIAVADANVFNGLHIGGFGAGVGVQFDHTFNATFPLTSHVYNYEVLAGTPFAVSGTPNAASLASPSRFYGLMSSNGAVAPTVAGTWTGVENLSSLANAANDSAASSAGVTVGGMYRNGSVLMVRVA